jgi:hypothetical protein
MGEYIPGAPVNDEVRKQNQNLPGMGGVFNVVNMHVYHYAGNNPIKYTDPDGEVQTPSQKRFVEVLSSISRLDDTASARFKSDFSIVVRRSKLDNGKNGHYYQSTLSVMYKGHHLNTISIQSTADEPNASNGLKGKTLPAGEYTGLLIKNSDSYLRPIHLSDGVNAKSMQEGDYYYFHPNIKTNISGSVPDPRPFSAGCQISSEADFNEVMNILNAVGFKVGDTINFKITPPVNEN